MMRIRTIASLGTSKLLSSVETGLEVWLDYGTIVADGGGDYFENLASLSPLYRGMITGDYGSHTAGEFDVSIDGVVDTQWLPNGDTYTIDQKFDVETEVLGSEEITNGDFATGDLTGWEAKDGVGVSVVSNAANINILASESAYGGIQTPYTITLGKTYRFSCAITNYVDALRVQIAGNGSGGLRDIVSNGTHVFEFTPTVSGVLIIQSNNVRPNSFTIDDVTLKELTVEEITESRVLTHDSADTDKLYINGVLEAGTPSLPSSVVTIKANSTAMIGDADTLSTHYDYLKCYSKVRTATQVLNDHNAWLLANFTVLTDGEGNYLVDGNGVYIIE